MHPPAARITAARSVQQLCRYQGCYLLHPAFLSCCIYLEEVSVTSLSIHYCATCRPEQLPDTTEDREGDCCSSCAVCSHKPDHCSGERCSPGPCMRTADVTCSLCSHSNSAVSGKWSLVVSINPLCTSSRCDLGWLWCHQSCGVELETNLRENSQSQRRLQLGPSPGWNLILML